MLLYDERFGDAKITGWGLPEYKIKRKDMTSEAYVHHVAAEWEKFVHGQMNKADNGMSYKKLPPIKESSDLIRRIWTVVDPAETKRRYQHV